MAPQKEAEKKIERYEPYVVLIDRSDAPQRINPSKSKAMIPRHLMNMKAAVDTIERTLAAQNVSLKVVRTAKLPLAQQVELVAHSRGLIGVHAAGLALALALPEGAALLELLPAAIPLSNTPANRLPVELNSQCGHSLFWLLAHRLNVSHQALLLRDFTFEDEIVVPLGPLATATAAALSFSFSKESKSDPPDETQGACAASAPDPAGPRRGEMEMGPG